MSGYYKNGRMPARVLAMYAKEPKKYARNAVRVALGNGSLIKPTQCERADETCTGRIEAHHASYAVDQWLAVEWLCASHHKRVHTKPTERIELSTARLRIGCSTAELSRRLNESGNEVATTTEQAA